MYCKTMQSKTVMANTSTILAKPKNQIKILGCKKKRTVTEIILLYNIQLSFSSAARWRHSPVSLSLPPTLECVADFSAASAQGHSAAREGQRLPIADRMMSRRLPSLVTTVLSTSHKTCDNAKTQILTLRSKDENVYSPSTVSCSV